MGRRQITWRDVAAEIVVIDDVPTISTRTFTAFSGCRVTSGRRLPEEEARMRTPKPIRDDLTRAFLHARIAAIGVDPAKLNEFARGLGALGLTPLGAAMIEAEAERLRSAASANEKWVRTTARVQQKSSATGELQ
jgi:hypothetical protein